MITRRSLFALALAACLIAPARAQQPPAAPEDAYAREHYTKSEYEIPMRDGAKLFTAVYVPKDRSTTYPIMLNRTPYSVGPYGVDNYRAALGPSDHFMKDGFIFVYQDVRGRYMSEGTWVEVRPHKAQKSTKADTDESTDTYDTIDWLVKHLPANNGRVGMWGISYPGFYVAAGMIDAHPALKAASPQAPVTDYYLGDDAFHNGAFMLAANYGFYSAFVERKGGPARPPQGRTAIDWGTPDGYDFYLKMGPIVNGAQRYPAPNPYWQINIDHTSYDDFWKARSIWRHASNITPAVMTVGGWFDAEDLQGPLRLYRAMEPTSGGRTNMLVMGPWTHGSWSRGDGDRVGNLRFGSKTSAFYREHIEFPFFTSVLKDRAPKAPLPEAYVFETGTNEWARYDTWPPKNATPTTFHLGPKGTLTASAPTTSAGFDEYVSDPNKPVPYVGYVTMGMRADYMTEDQRFAATRPDVLVYETPVLDNDLRVTGPIEVTLHVSTTGTDADFVVKVIDVYPNDFPSADGPGPQPANAVRMATYQQLVRGEPFRGKFRKSFETPEPFTPGTPATITFTMPDVAHVFRKGHKLMVQIQSSWFPLTDRNPQTFGHIPSTKPEDFKAQTHRVYRDAARPSAITLRVRP